MSSAATIVPAESDLLCERCGYILNGLPPEINCPECGKPIAESVGEHRKASEFETLPSLASFIQTDLRIILQPTRFFQTLAIRLNNQATKTLANLNLLLTILLFSVAALGHFVWIEELSASTWNRRANELIFAAIAIPGVAISMIAITKLAAWLSAIEAKYWGMRLPLQVVKRGLQFHSAHYLPVGILAVIIVWGYHWLLSQGIVQHTHDTIYLYVLCGFVVLSAVYLFQTYWIAMRNMRYANR